MFRWLASGRRMNVIEQELHALRSTLAQFGTDHAIATERAQIGVIIDKFGDRLLALSEQVLVQSEQSLALERSALKSLTERITALEDRLGRVELEVAQLSERREDTIRTAREHKEEMARLRTLIVSFDTRLNRQADETAKIATGLMERFVLGSRKGPS